MKNSVDSSRPLQNKKTHKEGKRWVFNYQLLKCTRIFSDKSERVMSQTEAEVKITDFICRCWDPDPSQRNNCRQVTLCLSFQICETEIQLPLQPMCYSSCLKHKGELVNKRSYMDPPATNVSEQDVKLSSVVHLFQPPSSKEGHLEQVVQVHIQLGPKYLQGQRCTTFLHRLS